MMAADADDAVALFALAPLGSGLILQGAPCPARDAVIAALARAGVALRRIPLHVAPDRLIGGIDIAASLAAGRPVDNAGLLQSGTMIGVLPMAERWEPAKAAPLIAAIDNRTLGIVACDESSGEEAMAEALADRCAWRVALQALPDDFTPAFDLAALERARALLPKVVVGDEMIEALCRTAAALGVSGMRAPLFAVRASCLAAAWAGRDRVQTEDAALAARLVLAPRATVLPMPEEPGTAETPDDADGTPRDGDDQPTPSAAELAEMILAAAQVVLPARLLAPDMQRRARRSATTGKSGDLGTARGHGRPAGSRKGVPRDGVRLDLIGTLRSAAPWQRLRGRNEPDRRLRITTGDLQVTRCRPRTATTTVFAVDASGSQALARLAEAKGAVELLLAECYVRRDRVALVAFRGAGADVLLPPTRAPARARRCLAALPGGGGTPLAAGILAAGAVAEAARRRGETPTIVLLTDGQANIGRDGAPGRALAQQDAVNAARVLAGRGHRALLIDTATRRQPLAQALAEALHARYLPLPRADAESVSKVVIQAVRSARP